MTDVQRGSVVLMRGFKRTTVNATVEATLTYKADKGRYDVFLYLGNIKCDAISEFDPNKILNVMGWEFVGRPESPLSVGGAPTQVGE